MNSLELYHVEKCKVVAVFVVVDDDVDEPSFLKENVMGEWRNESTGQERRGYGIASDLHSRTDHEKLQTKRLKRGGGLFSLIGVMDFLPKRDSLDREEESGFVFDLTSLQCSAGQVVLNANPHLLVVE